MRDDISAIREPKVCEKPLKKTLKKVKKKACQPLPPSTKRGIWRDKQAWKAVQKNFEKSEKKACQRPQSL